MPALARYVLTVDVEDYFQVEAFADVISRDSWEGWPSRVVANTHRTLDLLDEHNTRATFFILGWVAKRFPGLVREILARGHELACHSFWHRLVYNISPDEFRKDLREARDAIEQAGGVRTLGYRAPSWSITEKSIWALDILGEEGFVYDSSIFPVLHDIYGIPGAERFPYTLTSEVGRELAEFPPATLRWWGTNFPAAGGGWLRILPLWFTQLAMRRMAAEDGRAILVYFHPWELDSEQPRISGSRKARFRHYTNLSGFEKRLRALLSTYTFEPLRNVLETVRPREVSTS